MMSIAEISRTLLETGMVGKGDIEFYFVIKTRTSVPGQSSLALPKELMQEFEVN